MAGPQLNHQGNTNQNLNEISLQTVRMAVIKKKNNQCWHHVEKRQPSRTVGGNINEYSHYTTYIHSPGFPGGSAVKNLPAIQETQV